MEAPNGSRTSEIGMEVSCGADEGLDGAGVGMDLMNEGITYSHPQCMVPTGMGLNPSCAWVKHCSLSSALELSLLMGSYRQVGHVHVPPVARGEDGAGPVGVSPLCPGCAFRREGKGKRLLVEDLMSIAVFKEGLMRSLHCLTHPPLLPGRPGETGTLSPGSGGCGMRVCRIS